MDWSELFQMQKKLDDYILQNNNLFSKSLFNDKYLALLVELGELANETRCFKFWSNQERSSKETILEEYVDGLHFILSIGIETGFYFTENLAKKESVHETDQFNKVFEACVHFKNDKTEKNYNRLFVEFLQLGRVLGFNEKDIQRAYYDKNQVNYERQDEGY